MMPSKFVVFGIIGAVLAIGIVGALAIIADQRTARIDLSKFDVKQRSEYWLVRIQEVGGPTAYLELSESMRDFSSPQQHFNAHIFGDALYEAEKIQGIFTCDGKYAYACFHAFVIRAIEAEGADAAQRMHAACGDALGPTAEYCQHGIGHGVLGILGYEPEDIEKALEICDSLSPPSNKVNGCAGGVFMEHGLREMQSEGARDPRPFDLQKVLEPCASLQNAAYYPSCAYWLPLWWMETDPEREDDARMAKKMGGWCKRIQGGETAYVSCIAGITNRMQLLTNEDPLKTAHMCALITSDPNFQFYCQRKSAERYTLYHPLSIALKACEGLGSDSVVARCKERTTTATADKRADQEKYGRSALEAGSN